MMLQAEVVVGGGGGSDAIPIMFMLIAVVSGAVWLLTPIVRGLGRRLEGRSADAALQDEVAELRARLQELEGQQLRMQELEERMEFTERLLARQREAPGLGSGGDR